MVFRFLKSIAFAGTLLAVCNVFGGDKTVVALNPLSATGDLAAERELISDIMQATLSDSTTVTIVDRENMSSALKELQLGAQGMIDSSSVKKLGRIVGAKYFCSGMLRSSNGKTVVTVKVVDVETSVVKMAYATLANKAAADEVAKTLAANVEKLIKTMNEANAEASAASVAKEIPKDWKRPVVMVAIPELHIAQQKVIDPAAETEIVKKLIDSGFKVIDSEYAVMMKNDPSNAPSVFKDKKTLADYAAKKGADVLLYGEAISEFGAALEQFEGCRARVELKAVNTRNSEIILTDSAYAGATDLAEVVAGKKAIQAAAKKLADTFLYSLAEKWNKQASK